MWESNRNNENLRLGLHGPEGKGEIQGVDVGRWEDGIEASSYSDNFHEARSN
jgi:hypothetical protein